MAGKADAGKEEGEGGRGEGRRREDGRRDKAGASGQRQEGKQGKLGEIRQIDLNAGNRAEKLGREEEAEGTPCSRH
jgi:hypothetical protein